MAGREKEGEVAPGGVSCVGEGRHRGWLGRGSQREAAPGRCGGARSVVLWA